MILTLFGTMTFVNLEEKTSIPNGHSGNLMSRTEAEAYIAFEAWLVKHGKTYREQEEKNYRFGIFLENYKFVKEQNELYKKGVTNVELEINQFGDLHNAEFKYLYAGYKPNKNQN